MTINLSLKARIVIAARSGMAFTVAGIAALLGHTVPEAGQALLELQREHAIYRLEGTDLYCNLEAWIELRRYWGRMKDQGLV